MGIRYRKILLENLVDEDYYGYPSLSMTDFVGERNTSVVFLTEGMKVLEELIHIARENDWLNDFIPSLELNLKDRATIEKDPNNALLRDMRCLVKNLNVCLFPEICMDRKIWNTENIRAEKHTYLLSNELLARVLEFDDENIMKHLYAKYVCMKNGNDLLNGVDVYHRYIEIQYSEGNSGVISGTGRLKLKTKASPKNPPEKLGQE